MPRVTVRDRYPSLDYYTFNEKLVEQQEDTVTGNTKDTEKQK